jgi:hypothetical protein
MYCKHTFYKEKNSAKEREKYQLERAIAFYFKHFYILENFACLYFFIIIFFAIHMTTLRCHMSPIIVSDASKETSV